VIWIGTSGWSYDDWEERFYPAGLAKTDRLRFYATRFPTVEANSTFYHLPRAESVRRWRDGTSDGFVMAVKASRFLTHIKRLSEPAEPLKLFWERVDELGPRRGPILFQLPPRFRFDHERLAGLLEALPSSVHSAFEFRDPSWFNDDTYGLLTRSNSALVWPDRKGKVEDLPITADWLYVRLHQGDHSPFYTRRTLGKWAERLSALHHLSDIWVYFNNDSRGAAPRDATMLTEMLAERADVASLAS
jgi:uncharacterized protein YecE (DUF72 family)